MTGGPALSYCTADAGDDDKIAAELAYLRRERDILQARLDWIRRHFTEATDVDGINRDEIDHARVHQIADGDVNALYLEKLK